MVDKNFIGLDKPDITRFESYLPTAFSSELTLLQKVNKIIQDLNRSFDLTNEMVEYLNRFIETFDEKLYLTIDDILSKWLDDGLLAEIIRQAINDEVVEARNSGLNEKTLKARLDGYGTQESFRSFEVNTIIEKIKNEYNERGLNVKWFGAKGDGVTDDTAAIQSAIDFATLNNMLSRPKIFIPPSNEPYLISSLTVSRGLFIHGKAVLKVTGLGSIGLKMYSVLYANIEDLRIQLSDKNQIGIHIDTLAGQSGSQFNTFKDVSIEGGTIENTMALKISQTWTNSFYSCKFLRCADGVVFDHADANANFFYGCEIRHNYLHANAKMALLHVNGKNNGFIGGVIESYQDGVDVRSGTLLLDNIYTETIAVDRGIHLRGDGILIIKNSLLKTKVQILGGKSLIITECDFTRGAMPTNVNSPFIQFYGNYNTKVKMENNSIADDFIHARWGEYFDTTQLKWFKRSSNNIDEIYLDRDTPVIGSFDEASNATGDGTVFRLNFDDTFVLSNPYGELNYAENVFKPKVNGLYEIKILMRLGRLNSTHNDCSINYRERGVNYKSVVLVKENLSVVGVDEKSEILSGSIIFQTSIGLPGNFELVVNGTDKIVFVGKNTAQSILNQFSIRRIA